MRWRVYVVNTEELFPNGKGAFLRRLDAATYIHYLKKDGLQAYAVWSGSDDDLPFDWSIRLTSNVRSRMMQ